MRTGRIHFGSRIHGMFFSEDRERESQGLLRKATVEDMQNAINADGTPVDLYKVAATRLFKVAYDDVTEDQRHAAKRAAHLGMYR